MTKAATRTSISHKENITLKSDDVKLPYATFYGGVNTTQEIIFSLQPWIQSLRIYLQETDLPTLIDIPREVKQTRLSTNSCFSDGFTTVNDI